MQLLNEQKRKRNPIVWMFYCGCRLNIARGKAASETLTAPTGMSIQPKNFQTLRVEMEFAGFYI
jgi:hypothetical protein